MVGTRAIEDAAILQVAKNIARRRRQLGLTQAQFAERLGIELKPFRGSSVESMRQRLEI